MPLGSLFHIFLKLVCVCGWGVKKLHMLRGSDATEIFMLPGVGVC